MNSNQQTPNTPPQQQPDPLGQVLSALAHTEAPTGMDHRILQALEAQTLQPVPRRPLWLRWKPNLTFSFAVATLFFILVTLQYPHHHPEPKSGPATNYIPAVHRTGNISLPPPPTRVPHVPLLGRGIPQLHPALDTPPPSLTLVSYPAPPMPLTGQEHLLLRIAHRDDPQALAALTPEQFASQQAQDNAAFEDFFPPAVPVEYPTLISQSTPPAPVPTPNPGASK